MSHQIAERFPNGYGIAHCDGEPSPETEEAIRAVMRAAYKQLEDDDEQTSDR